MAVLAKNQLPPTINRSNQFSTGARDPNHGALNTDNYPYYQDATGTPVTSPAALSGTAVLINIPAAAVSITIIGAVDIRVSDTSGMTAGYAVCPAKVPVTIPVATPSINANDPTGQLWIVNDSTAGNCSFIFNCR